MLSSTRLFSLALLLVGALNVAAVPTPLTQAGDLVERQLPGAKKPAANAPAPAKVPSKPPVPVQAPARGSTKPAPPANPPAKGPTPGPSKPPSRPPGPPQPPQKPPSRPATPPATKKPKGAPKPQECNTIENCSSCIASTKNCHFDKVSFTCASRTGNTLNKVTTRDGCPQMLQMQKV